jgi:hypothetical protein
VIPTAFLDHEVPIGEDVVEFEHIIYHSLREKENSMPRLLFTQTDIMIRDSLSDC